MEIRKSKEEDLPQIMRIYEAARAFMAQNGNPLQWGPTNWPPESLVRNDIATGNGYVCEHDGRPVGAFFFDAGKDIEPTYASIVDGSWLSDAPYGVVHRVASDGSVRGVGRFCIEWAFGKCGHLRIDTHGDNAVMQHLMDKMGFVHCGTIYVEEDDYPRLAYEKVNADLLSKYDDLRSSIASLERIAVAFSGGVDSTLLLKVAHDVLGENALAITGKSPSIPSREIEEAKSFCKSEGIEHIVVDTNEFAIEGFELNPPDRCYICKRELLACVRAAASAKGAEVIAEGSNLDDDGDYRPGFKAVKEMGVVSPLRESGLAKSDVRALARLLGLSVWNKPAYACLNTRFAYGELITSERLAMVDAAENALHDCGFTQVRVRMQDNSARIEVPESDIARLVADETRRAIVSALQGIGFDFIAVDLQGYRMGSMNATL